MGNEYIIVKSSLIHYKGVFAQKDIPQGTRIIEYVGEKVSKEESEKRENQTLQESKQDSDKGSVYMFELDDVYDIDGNVDWNDARFINHSCEPNCEIKIMDGHIWVYALRDIKDGEELSYDYGYDVELFKKHPCKCGSPNCVGYIVAQKHRDELKKALEAKA